MESKSTVELEAESKSTQTAAKASPPTLGAIATAICAVLGIVGAVLHSQGRADRPVGAHGVDKHGRRVRDPGR